MSSADAPSAAVRTMIPPSGVELLDDVLQARALVVLEPARDAEPLALRDEDDEAAGERDLGREPRALRLHRILDGLDQDLLAARDQVGDLLAVPLALELGHDDLVDVEEAVLLEPDLDERRLHARQDVVDGAEVDVAGDRAAFGPLEVDLGDAVVLEHGDALLADVDRDEQLALGLRQRRPALLRAAARLAGAALLALARAPAGCRFVRSRLAGSLAATGAAACSLARGRGAPPGRLRPRPPRLPRRRFFDGSVDAASSAAGDSGGATCAGALDGGACSSSFLRFQRNHGDKRISLGGRAQRRGRFGGRSRAARDCEKRRHGLPVG